MCSLMFNLNSGKQYCLKGVKSTFKGCIMEAEVFSLTDSFSADDYVINIIRRAVSNNQNILIDNPNHGRVTVLASAGEYLTDLENLKSFCQLPASSFKITVLNEDKAKNFKTSIGRNIDELLWCAGFYASEGRLLDDGKWDDVLELSHWPNFTRIPMSFNFLRIASLLSKHPTSVERIIVNLKIPREEVYQFYCAARCSGAIRINNSPATEAQFKPHRNNALLSLLLNKIVNI